MSLKHYLLFYSVTDEYLTRRPLYRDAHLSHAWTAQQRGILVLAGAVADPLDTGLLLFKAGSPQQIEEFARQDPYVVNGLVTSWRVREWLTVVGTWAIDPIYPPGIDGSARVT
jgi:uncharacterized protein YciI